MHEYLVGVKLGVHGAVQAISGPLAGFKGHQFLGDAALLVLVVMGGIIWFLITYVAPLLTVLKGPLATRRAWIFAVYYLAIQVPVFWVYAEAWQTT
jgi:hypothetical protein